MFDLEYFANTDFVAGTDEVGRGCLAGPVVSATLVIGNQGHHPFLQKLQQFGITDSKGLTSKKRLQLLRQLEIDISVLRPDTPYKLDDESISFAIAEVGSQEIDKINILNASLLAMENSLKTCLHSLGPFTKGTLLIDGNKPLKWHHPCLKQIPIVKGDLKSLIIGLASIIAKEYRDLLMQKMDSLYANGAYAFSKHVGYPTKEHKLALRQLGASPIHRLSYAPLKEL
ncbi:MAG: ribonuclease HII [Oligoflexia bacterium]|nr:ribonuclease HII [Oligoflexia bacterium]MBF0367142.1 ribonuclease HII [Oligoflexia bacterium]